MSNFAHCTFTVGVPQLELPFLLHTVSLMGFTLL